MLKLLGLLSIFVYTCAAQAKWSFDAAGDYVYSSLSYGGSSSFSMPSKTGTMGQLGVAIGGNRWDLLLNGQVTKTKFEVPSNYTVNTPDLQTNAFGAGVRLRVKGLWLHLNLEDSEELYLENTGASTYDLRKKALGFGNAGFKVFGLGEGYLLSVDGDLSLPLQTASTPAGTMKYNYDFKGVVHVDFGRRFRVGLQVGADRSQYTVSTDTYTRTDLTVGLEMSFDLGVGFTPDSNDPYYLPNYPL